MIKIYPTFRVLKYRPFLSAKVYSDTVVVISYDIFLFILFGIVGKIPIV